MVNYNGELLEKESCALSIGNRGYRYGDSLFETIRIKNGEIRFSEDHYFRLMASMRMLRMDIPMNFTLEYFEAQILNLVQILSDKTIGKVRFTVDRKEGGLYTPTNNDINFLVEAFEVVSIKKESYRVDLYKDHYVTSGLLSTVKSSNRLLNVLAGIYADENELDNCILINENKSVVEATNANIFLVKGTVIRTPKLADGCIKGIARKKIIELLAKNDAYTLEEVSISPFDLQKADELFVSNAIMGIQSITNYRKKTFSTEVGTLLSEQLEDLV
ncbi:aminotransferase class IV [Flavicella sediminum]|uniref:aminotransferase class IV n=1 Tax=Flavicella sediminum TaxID=2585141 RepID=UPI00111EFE6A|nr:aminotransferase class IV [Flavicella sediminum]